MDNEQIYSYTEPENKKSAMCVWSLILGILSILFAPGLVLAIIGLVLGNKSVNANKQPQGVAKAGKIVSIIALILSILKLVGGTIALLVFLLFGGLAASSLGDYMDKINEYEQQLNNYDTDIPVENLDLDDISWNTDFDPDYNPYADDELDVTGDNLNTEDDGLYAGTDTPVYDENGELIGYQSDILTLEGAQIVGSINGVRFVTPEGFQYGYGDATYAVYMTDIADYEFPAYVYNDGTDFYNNYEKYVALTNGVTLDDDIYKMYNSKNERWDCRAYYFVNDLNEFTLAVYAVCEEGDTCVILMARPKGGADLSEENFYAIFNQLDELTCNMYCHCKD